MYVLDFEYEKETKGAYRFKEIPVSDGTFVVGTLYIRKTAIAVAPKTLVVTIDQPEMEL